MRSLVVVLLLTCAPAAARADGPEPTWLGAVVHVGYATTPGPLAASGPRFGVGYRVELSRLAFEATLEAEKLEPDLISWADWNHTAKAKIRADYVHAFDDLAVRLGGGLGYGTERVWTTSTRDDDPYPWQHEQDGAHAELRAGIALGRGPIATLDAGVRLPLFRMDAGWQPTFDVSLGIGVGTMAPSKVPARYRGGVVIADLLSAAALWVGAAVIVSVMSCECGDDAKAGAGVVAMTAGLLGYAIAAPVIHVKHHNGAGAAISLALRVTAGALGVLATGDEEGVVLGVLAGAALAPVFDYVIAARSGD